MYKYFQLLDTDYNDLVEGDDNPASIPDGTHGQSAAKMAREWMKANGVAKALLVINAVTEDSDSILSQRELSIA